jgi:hypothetical protein
MAAQMRQILHQDGPRLLQRVTVRRCDAPPNQHIHPHADTLPDELKLTWYQRVILWIHHAEANGTSTVPQGGGTDLLRR